MAEIDEINEVDLFNNIKNRFLKKNIFNNVGQTIIVVNPCQPIETTSNEVLESYIKVYWILFKLIKDIFFFKFYDYHLKK